MQPLEEQKLAGAAAAAHAPVRAHSMETSSTSSPHRIPPTAGGRRIPLNALQRQVSLPAAPQSPARALPKLPGGRKTLVRMNSDPKMLPSSEDARKEEKMDLDSMEELELLHKIAKAPNLLKTDAAGGGKPKQGKVVTVPVITSDAAGNKKKLVKQKSLNRTLSTSVLSIPKKRTFWSAV